MCQSQSQAPLLFGVSHNLDREIINSSMENIDYDLCIIHLLKNLQEFSEARHHRTRLT